MQNVVKQPKSSLKCAHFRALFLSTLFFTFAGCGSAKETASSNTTTATGPTCTSTALTGTSWVPNIRDKNGTLVATSHHNAATEIYKNTYTGSGFVTGLTQSYDSSHVITVSGIVMSTDLLANGSISLVAKPTSIPSAFASADIPIYPMLVSLSDGTNEWVNVTGCTGGFYSSCSDDDCTEVSACGPKSPTAFVGSSNAERKSRWEEQHSLLTNEQISVTSFPTCNWAAGSPSCEFNTSLFSGGKLRTGTYTAKYVMVASTPTNLSNNYSVGLQVDVIRKKSATSVGGGALDLNVVLVGTKNIRDSRTEKGKQNLDALFAHFYNHYNADNASAVGVKLGAVNVYEWICENGGDVYANVDLSDRGEMFSVGSSLVDSASESKAVNIFLVSTIPYSSTNYTVLGVSGGIVGSMLNGTTRSGLAFSTFDSLASYNSRCSPGSDCTILLQESDFIEMGGTISHEVGHFLGLYHPSESNGSDHDPIPDTPSCSSTSTIISGGRTYHQTTISSCRSVAETDCRAVCSSADYLVNNPYCADKAECQFNHVMWWTSKDHDSNGNGNGNLFSAQSGKIMNYSSFVQ